MAVKKTFDVNYFGVRNGVRQFNHKYSETWEFTDLFCPRCGKRDVCREDSEGDFYVGELYICLGCSGTFHLPTGVEDAKGEQHEQRLEKLR